MHVIVINEYNKLFDVCAETPKRIGKAYQAEVPLMMQHSEWGEQFVMLAVFSFVGNIHFESFILADSVVFVGLINFGITYILFISNCERREHPSQSYGTPKKCNKILNIGCRTILYETFSYSFSILN